MDGPDHRRALLACGALTALLLLALGLLRGEAFWSTSDGVYALSARELLHGLDLYSGVAAAQPPPVYLAGAALLGVDDSLTMLRAGLELAALATALLVWLAVWRLTQRPWLAVAAGVATPLLPVMLHENALLTPETIGAPLLLGVAVLAARPGGAAWAGALAAVAASTKLSFALPALAVLLVSPVRRRAIAWFAGTGVLLAAAGTLIWGGDLWRSIITAQAQSGNTALRNLGGLLAQEGWNLIGLVVLAGLGLRARVLDAELRRTVVAAAAGSLVLGLTVVKLGTYVNVVQVAEPPLLVLGAVGLASVTARARVVAFACVALLVAQSGSLLIHPSDPRPYTRPFAESGPRRLLSDGQVERFARAPRACPAGAPYPGIPYLAFVAHRRAPGDQPDVFILNSESNGSFRARYQAELPAACPPGAPTVDPNGNAG
ncbi:MAG: hypothetical protein ACJ762_18125 [Solirubrobacteraceae bacterium]